MSIKVIVDQSLCTGCSLCVDLFPDIFTIDENDLAKGSNDIPESKEDECFVAMDSCPAKAIKVK